MSRAIAGVTRLGLPWAGVEAVRAVGSAGVSGRVNRSNPAVSPETDCTSVSSSDGNDGGEPGKVTASPWYVPERREVSNALSTSAVVPVSESERRSGQEWSTERPWDSKYCSAVE